MGWRRNAGMARGRCRGGWRAGGRTRAGRGGGGLGGPGGAGRVEGVKLMVRVLMYHQIAGGEETSSRLAVPPEAFAAQLAYLNAAGFTTVTASALAAAVSGDAGRMPVRPVVLTFDDGFADFHQVALPLLREYGFTATGFVTTGWIQDAGPRSAGRRPGRLLSWSQLLEAAGAGAAIGAHSPPHPPPGHMAGTGLP